MKKVISTPKEVEATTNGMVTILKIGCLQNLTKTATNIPILLNNDKNKVIGRVHKAQVKGKKLIIEAEITGPKIDQIALEWLVDASKVKEVEFKMIPQVDTLINIG